MVDIRAQFFIPSRYGDDVEVESQITEFGRSSFNVHHRLLRGEELAAEGFEKRVWVGADPAHPGKIKALNIPQEIKDCFANH